MASRKQRVAALGEFRAATEFRGLTSIRDSIATTRKNRSAAMKQWREADNLRALTAREGMQIGIDFDLGEIEDLLDRLAEFAPDALEELDEIGRRVAFDLQDEIVRDWPVDTGFSKSQWDTVKIRDAAYAVVNLAVYSGIVHRSGQSETVAEEIMRELVPRAQQEYAQAAESAMAKLTGRGR